jgi:hypothetical protein
MPSRENLGLQPAASRQVSALTWHPSHCFLLLVATASWYCTIELAAIQGLPRGRSVVHAAGLGGACVGRMQASCLCAPRRDWM